MDLNSASVFVRVVQAGSFSEAARQLKMPVSTVSTRVSHLEDRLGVSLLRRTTRKLQLTDAGTRYFEHAVRAVSAIQEAEASTSHDQEEARGLVRLTATVEMGMSTLSDAVAAFLDRYPEVQVELVLTDRMVDLVADGVDLAIRVGELEDSSLVARKLGTTAFQAFASAAYLKRAGEPRRPKDLETHQCLGFQGGAEGSWELRHGEKRARVHVRGRFAANNLAAVRRLALHGHGIALLPGFLCAEDLERGKLTQVLKGWSSEDAPVHLVHAPQKFLPRRVRALSDFLVENLDEVF